MKQWIYSSVIVFSSALLSACGGGGTIGGDSNSGTNPGTTPGTGTTTPTTPTAPTWIAGQYAAESTLQNFCATPRSGTDPFSNSAYPDKAGTAMHEKLWLRSWSNRTYLWYKELPDLDPASYSTLAYFDLLKTSNKTDSGAAKDNFHFYQDTAEYKKQTQSAVTSGYGIEWIFTATRPPRQLTVAYTEPGSPAATALLSRGSKLLEVDGIDFVNDNTQAGVNAINAALFPAKAGESHQFTVQQADGSRKSFTLQSADVSTVPVHNVKVLQSGSKKVGYLQFNTHIAAAQPQLISAVEQFRNEAVSELVVDLRYNGGGLLALASQFGYMVSGPNQIQSRYFDKLQFNDKYPNTDPVTGEALEPTPFYSRGIDYNAGRLTNQTLPNLSLNRIFVLTTDNTCSASEAFINALRGIDVEVIQIGGKTCGKPYGFYPTDNCGTTYFTIQFSGVNAKGFGDYAAGFTPKPAPQFAADIKGCPVADDLSKPLGDAQEGLLKTALFYAGNNSCPVLTAAQQAQTQQALSAAAPLQSDGLAIRDPRQQEFMQHNLLRTDIRD
ncbi:S41 family peptidase [Rheinheimera texasensis]|uniref:S41 family peptidase n=1 Tax=Rheinheimera texasensis TaxID=306205 RepID=UPI0004E1A4EE|nr:S41 family peptidase [Rheinheimera texasensis]